MHSTYSVIPLGRNKSLTLLTTSSTLTSVESTAAAATTATSHHDYQDQQGVTGRPKIVEKISKSILPLYPQFVYSIRVVSGDERAPSLVDVLNEQGQEASKIRFALPANFSFIL